LVSQPLTRGNISHATNTTEVNIAETAPVLTDVDYAIETIPSSNEETTESGSQQHTNIRGDYSIRVTTVFLNTNLKRQPICMQKPYHDGDQCFMH
jgi:hypothetical protein